MQTNFDFQGARNSGYSDEEISSYLSESNPSFDVKGAMESGYSPEEINEFLSSEQPKENQELEKKPERSFFQKTGRVAGQYALGVAENALLPYELSVASLASPQAQSVVYRQNVADDIERLMEQKATGQWSEQDQELYDHLTNQIQNPDESSKFVQTANIGIRDITQAVTGIDTKPEGFTEKVANWTGFIKNPKNLVNLKKIGLSASQVIKGIAPSGTELMRGIGGGAALELAEQGNFGPIGTMAALVVGDLIGAGTAGIAKAGINFISEPKKSLAEIASKFTPSDKIELQKDIIKDFQEANIQADLGTLTDSNLVKWIQSRLAQSGLAGKSLDDLKKTLTDQIKKEYKALADSLGEAKYASNYEAGLIAREGMKSIREAELSDTRKLYAESMKALKEKPFVQTRKLTDAIEKLEKELKPGQLKSSEQKTVLSVLEDLKRDIFDSSGKPMYGNVKDLINNKIALNDIINYEVQGGTKQLLKGIVGELDRAIISHGRENPGFAKNYIKANRKFSEHAKTFRNPQMDKVLKEPDPEKFMSKMNTVQDIKNIEKILSKTSQGQEIFSNLKRLKLDNIIGNNLVDSTTQQVKLGTFSKLLQKKNNKAVAKELLGPQSFKRLERLQTNAGRLADAAEKFYNASKSGVVAADAAVMTKVLYDIISAISGNPWPLLKTSAGIVSTRKLSNLLGDPEFLKLVEEAIISSERGSQAEMLKSFEKLKPYLLPLAQETTSQNE